MRQSPTTRTRRPCPATLLCSAARAKRASGARECGAGARWAKRWPNVGWVAGAWRMAHQSMARTQEWPRHESDFSCNPRFSERSLQTLDPWSMPSYFISRGPAQDRATRGPQRSWLEVSRREGAARRCSPGRSIGGRPAGGNTGAAAHRRSAGREPAVHLSQPAVYDPRAR